MEPLQPNFNPFPVLETERMLLRAFTPDDAPAVLLYRSNADAMRYIPRPIQSTLDDALNMIREITDMIAANDGICWAMELKSNREVIGSMSYHLIHKQHHRAELGYMIHPSHWGKGYVSEAVKALLDYGFDDLKCHSLEAIIDPLNTASERVLLKAGFVKEGHFKENFVHNGEFTDTAIYSLLREDYLKAKKSM